MGMRKAVPGLLQNLASRHETEGELLTLTLTGFSKMKGYREEKERYKEAERLRERTRRNEKERKEPLEEMTDWQ